jgi:hypothetical protein
MTYRQKRNRPTKYRYNNIYYTAARQIPILLQGQSAHTLTYSQIASIYPCRPNMILFIHIVLCVLASDVDILVLVPLKKTFSVLLSSPDAVFVPLRPSRRRDGSCRSGG